MERASDSMPLEENILVPRNKTKLAHCLIICVTRMVCGRRRCHRCREAHLSTCDSSLLYFYSSLHFYYFFSSRFSLSLVFLVLFACYHWYHVYILLLFVSMWAPPPPPSPPSLIVRIVDDICVHNISFIAARNHAVSCAAVVSIFVASFLLHFVEVKRGKSTAENRFVISSLFCLRSLRSLFIIICVSSIDSISWYAHRHSHARHVKQKTMKKIHNKYRAPAAARLICAHTNFCL